MNRPPRSRREGVIRRPMLLLRAWLFLGLIAATLQMGAFFLVLIQAGWHPARWRLARRKLSSATAAGRSALLARPAVMVSWKGWKTTEFLATEVSR